jgi:hypothetical protein
MDVTRFAPLHVFVTTPGVVAIISAVIGGVVAGLLTIQAAPSMNSAVGVGFVVSIVLTVLLILYERRESRAYLARMIRFQDSRDRDAVTPQEGGRR